MLFFLGKVFRRKEYATDFLEGRLFAQRLCYFKQLEDPDGRGDEDEGAIVIAKNNALATFDITNTETGDVDRIDITSEDLAASMSIRPKWYDHVNVYCMYAAHSGDFELITEENIKDFTKQLELPNQYHSLGDHATIVTDVGEFLTRVHRATEREGYRIRRELVDYYDYAAGTPQNGTGLDTIFAKRSDYAWQREYRLAIDTGELGCDPLSLEIGAIDDIAFYVPTREINSIIRISFPEGMA